MPRNNKKVGAEGEASAAFYLQSRGYEIVAKNVRPEGGMGRGEIDIIAWDRSVLAFVEVKTRRAALGPQGAPAESIHPRKQRQLVHLAECYLAEQGLSEQQCRFDWVEIIEGQNGFARFRLVKNAFDASMDEHGAGSDWK